MANPKGTVTLTVTNFVPLLQGSGGFTDADITKVSGKGPVTKAKGSNGTAGLKATSKKNKPVDIEFIIEPAGTYVVGGLCFVGKPGVTDTNGQNNFGDVKLNGSAVTVTDYFVDLAPGASAPIWAAKISIIRLADLALGVIDPDVENSEDSKKGG